MSAVPEIGTCRCPNGPGVACGAPPTQEDLLCDGCRMGAGLGAVTGNQDRPHVHFSIANIRFVPVELQAVPDA